MRRETVPPAGSRPTIPEPTRSGATQPAAAGIAPTSLRRNFSWTLIGNVTYAACQWGMLTVLVKLGSAEMVGQFALSVAITTPIFAFANLQLRNIQATDARGEYGFGDYLGLRMATTALAMMLTIAIALLGKFDASLGVVIVVAGLIRVFDAFSDVIHGYLQQREDMFPIAGSMMLNGVLSLALLAAGVAATGDLVYGMIGSAVASAAVLALYNVPILARRGTSVLSRASLMPDWTGGSIARLAWLALPMGLVMTLSSLDMSVPRFVIERELGQDALGVFAALAYLIFAGTTVVVAFGQSASPKLARHFANGEHLAFARLLLALGGTGLLLGVAGAGITVAGGAPIVRLLYSEQYAAHVDTLTILTVAAGIQFAASFAGFGMTAARRFRAQVPLYTAVVVVTLVANSVMVPRFGLNGAAVSIGIGAVVSLVGGCGVILHATTHARRTSDEQQPSRPSDPRS